MKGLQKRNQNRRPCAKKWSTKETEVFVSVWKEISEVSEVGNGKSVKQCKLKLRHMKAS